MARLLGLTILTLVLCIPRAYADNASEARTRYERAVKLYEDGVYDAALVEFTRAYELNPSYKVLYNLAQVRVAMQDYAGASEALQQYLRDGGSQIPEQRGDAVRQELARLEQRVARLTIQSDVRGAEVLVDDALVGTTPLAGAVLVNSGMRRVTVRDSEHDPQTSRVSVAGGEQRTITLNLIRGAQSTTVAPPAPLAVQPAPDVAATSVPTKRADGAAAKWSVTGVTAGLIVTAAALGIAALVQNKDLDDRRTKPMKDAAFDDDRHRMHKLAVAADVLGLAAIAGVGISTWLWLRPSRERRVDVAWTGTGARLRGEF